MKLKLLIVLTGIMIAGCAGNPPFPQIGANMSNPLYVAVNSVTGRMYVVNSNYTAYYTDGSIHVVDISTPATPAMLDYQSIPEYASQLYLDTVTNVLYTPNRLNDDLEAINVDEGSANFLGITNYTTGLNPFGIACCDSSGRMFVAPETSAFLDYYNETTDMAHAEFSMASTMDIGGDFLGYYTQRIAIIGDRAVVTNLTNGFWIVELDQIGDAGTYPVDYFVQNVTTPSGIATDGVNVYLLDYEVVGGVSTPTLLVLDISTLPARVGNTTTQYIEDKSTIAGLVTDSITLTPASGAASTPAEVVINGTTAYASDQTANIISIVDLTTAAKTGEIATGLGPYGMNFYSPLGVPTHLIVANSIANNVQLIDIAGNTIVGTYP